MDQDDIIAKYGDDVELGLVFGLATMMYEYRGKNAKKLREDLLDACNSSPGICDPYPVRDTERAGLDENSSRCINTAPQARDTGYYIDGKCRVPNEADCGCVMYEAEQCVPTAYTTGSAPSGPCANLEETPCNNMDGCTWDFGDCAVRDRSFWTPGGTMRSDICQHYYGFKYFSKLTPYGPIPASFMRPANETDPLGLCWEKFGDWTGLDSTSGAGRFDHSRISQEELDDMTWQGAGYMLAHGNDVNWHSRCRLHAAGLFTRIPAGQSSLVKSSQVNRHFVVETS